MARAAEAGRRTEPAAKGQGGGREGALALQGQGDVRGVGAGGAGGGPAGLEWKGWAYLLLTSSLLLSGGGAAGRGASTFGKCACTMTADAAMRDSAELVV